MDSERRHELETNDLREFLDNFKDFWDKHANKVLGVLIVALLVYAGPKYYNNWKTSKADEANAKLASATNAQTLLGVAAEYPLVHDEAMRRAGDILLGEAREALIDGDEQAGSETLAKADSAYTALASRGQTTEYQLLGHEGLAKTAEMQDKWDDATAQYQKVIDLAGETYLAQATRAQAGLDRIDLLKDPIAFAPPEPEPAPEPAPEGETPAEEGADAADPAADAPADADPAAPVIEGLDQLDPTSD